MAIPEDLATLADMYGSLMTDSQIDLYIEALSDIDPETLHAGIIEIIKTSKWMPKVSEIRQAVEAITTRRESEYVMNWHTQNKRVSPWTIRGFDAISPNRTPTEYDWKTCGICGVSYANWEYCPDCEVTA